MDTEVLAKIDKLLVKYIEIQGILNSARPAILPPMRAQSQLLMMAQTTLGHLQTARKPQGAAIVRLAFVRGLRELLPEARLTDLQLHQIEVLEHKLSGRLAEVEIDAYVSFRDHLRLLVLESQINPLYSDLPLNETLKLSGKPYPMVDFARSVLIMAAKGAMVAGTKAGEASKLGAAT